MKKTCMILSLILILISLTGCWDYMEVEDMGIISTLTVDIDEESGLYIVNVEIIDVQSSTSGATIKPLLVESQGKTIAEAIRNNVSLITKRINWSHASVVILSQDAAKKGIEPILDWILRNPQTRLTIHPFISDEKTAKEIIIKEENLSKIRSLQFPKIKRANEFLAKTPHIEVFQVTNQITNKELHPVLPTIGLKNINGKFYADIKGAAYLKQDKLAGFLDPIDTMKYLFIIDELKNGILVIDTGENPDDKVTLNIHKSHTRIEFKFKEDNIEVMVNIHPIVSITEIDNSTDYTNKSGRAELAKLSNKHLEQEIAAFIRGFQSDPGIDIFNFGHQIKKRYPNTWKSIEGDWNGIFKELDITVNSNIKIRSSAHISRPLKISD